MGETTRSQPEEARLFPVCLIHVRAYKPLSVSFPAPGVYRGHIRIVLPDSDPGILGRLNPGGTHPAVLAFETDEEITAQTILEALQANIDALQAVSGSIASPIRRRLFSSLRVTVKDRRATNRKLIDLDNPLESPQD